MAYQPYFLPTNCVANKRRPRTAMPILLNNLLFTIILTFINTAEQQYRNGKANFTIAQMPKANTLSP
ncbi:MAG: hypothetical protein ACYC5R_11450 [Melioribacteraceae bacterium]